MQIQRSEPVSEQITRILMERIRSGAYRSGELFPSETELCAEFGVSRASVRTALSGLAAQGILVRKPGVGTFLSYHPQRLETGLEQLESVISTARRQGSNTRIVDLTVEEIPASPFLSENLSVSEGAPVTAVRRTILVDGHPASYHEDYVSAAILPSSQMDRHFDGSVLDLLSQKISPPVHDAVCEITAVNADQDLSARLGVPAGASVILLREKIYDQAGALKSYSENYFVPDRFFLRVIRNKNPNTSKGG